MLRLSLLTIQWEASHVKCQRALLHYIQVV